MGEHSGDHGHAVKKTSISEEEIRKILVKAKVQMPSESPKYTSSPSSGTMHASIEGRYKNERSRLSPSFTESDRQWRVKYLESQNLHPAEPFEVPELSRVNYNPIRRFYRFPMDMFEKFLNKYMEKHTASATRKLVGGTITGYFVVLAFWYQLSYNRPNWEYFKGMRTFHSREAVFPGDVRYPKVAKRTESWQYYDRGFHDRKVFLSKD